jgi:hypothetical protein
MKIPYLQLKIPYLKLKIPNKFGVRGSGGSGELHCLRQGREFAGQFQFPLFQAENLSIQAENPLYPHLVNKFRYGDLEAVEDFIAIGKDVNLQGNFKNPYFKLKIFLISS